MEIYPNFDAPYNYNQSNNKPRAVLLPFVSRRNNKQLVLLSKRQNDVLSHFTETTPYYLYDMRNTLCVIRSFVSFASNLLTYHSHTHVWAGNLHTSREYNITIRKTIILSWC